MKKIILQIMFMSVVSMMAFAGDYEGLDGEGIREAASALIATLSAPNKFFSSADFTSLPSDAIQFLVDNEIDGACSRRRTRQGLKPYSPEDIAEIKGIVFRHFNLDAEDGGGDVAEAVAAPQEIPAPPALPAPQADMLARNGARPAEQPRAEIAQAPLAQPVARNGGGNGLGFNAADLENAAGRLKPARARAAEAGAGGGARAAAPARPQAQQGRMAFGDIDFNQARQGLKPVAAKRAAAPAAEAPAGYMQEEMDARRQGMGYDSDESDDEDDWSDDDGE